MSATVGAGDVARSGLRFQRQRLETSASNVANARTDGYQKGRVVAEETEHGGVRGQFDRVELSERARNLSEQQAGPQNNVSVAEELVDQIESEAGFEANLATLQTHFDMQGSVLKMMD